jgi:hypothetical protein
MLVGRHATHCPRQTPSTAHARHRKRRLRADAFAARLPSPRLRPRACAARLAVVVGSEGAGVSQTMIDAADRTVFLPMSGFSARSHRTVRDARKRSRSHRTAPRRWPRAFLTCLLTYFLTHLLLTSCPTRARAAESFNVSVAAALVLQRLLDAAAGARGQLPADEMARLRAEWYAQLARSEEQRDAFARLAAQGGAPPYQDTRRPEAHREEQRMKGGRRSAFQSK